MAHEVQIWRYDASSVLDKLIGVDEAHGELLDEVGDSYCWASTDSCLAVDKHRATSRSRQVDEVKSLLEILLQVLVAVVCGMQLLVGDRLGHVVGRGDCRHIEHMVDSETGESSSVAGILHVAKEEEGGDLAGRVVLNVLGDTQVSWGRWCWEPGHAQAWAMVGSHQVIFAQ